ncbi:helix-turn-helix domain-containing protein [Arcanobacterium phocae]|uniref:helix-turn-helix domain-containing protein n=1 Tax=Arcanobacterium phocae TaxID=131112 RepID=UPI001C0F33E5|nr:helix-turn-helix transcriptional regulator [Arcanobacterium phocae]
MTAPTVSYKPLWKTLIDKDMTKQDLRKATGLSSATIAKLGRDETVTTQVLARICGALGCQMADIVEVVPNRATKEA